MAQLPSFRLSAPQGFVLDQRTLDGWDLLADVPLREGISLELAPVLRNGEEGVSQDVLRARAHKLGGLTGQRHAERLLTLVDRIPRAWEEFGQNGLIFPGTLWLPRQRTIYELEEMYGWDWPEAPNPWEPTECPIAIPLLRNWGSGWRLEFRSGDSWGCAQRIVRWR